MGDSEHYKQWVGTHVSAIVLVDEHVQLEASVLDGWVDLELAGESGDFCMRLTPDAAKLLAGKLVENADVALADSGTGGAG